MVNSADFTKRLQLVMEKHDLKASSFAEKIGVGRSSMSHILSGRNKPSLDFVLAVLKTFKEVDLYWLLNGRGTYPNKSSDAEVVSTEKNQEAPLPSSRDLHVVKEKPSTKNTEDQNKNGDFLPDRGISKKGKNISRVIIFYEDGTFENFIP